MKRIIFATLAILFISSCSRFESKQQRAQALVKSYLDSALNDPKSYENVKFTKIDTLYSIFEQSPQYFKLKEKSDSLVAAFDEWKLKNPDFDDSYGDLSHERAQYFIKMINYYSNPNIEVLKKIADMSKDFKPSFIGYKIIDQYRAKNGFGALVLHETSFKLDSGITKIIATDNIE